MRRISRRGLIPGIQGSKTGTLSAIGSRDLVRARAWAEEFGISKACGTYEEILADAEIDAVYLPLPNELHKRWVEAAADAGKHILCEKPLALDAAEARHDRVLPVEGRALDGSLYVAASAPDSGAKGQVWPKA